ncbi:MAG: hypothetical protein A3C61_02490 [Candidatus Yanofskybacteria bacterium RIFCSPHIGHO2_02_FULL_39_10]|uniref:Uncharacterized protein n=1 Tax=Candidatus Yanofskybacteria bacterium RIFCSPHIGHO2_02_FULL_39_10 TaxID=1802674 RepID=A0A1F8F745_9BACT|nr:MAG: hypothetical protein A3C61_02490 [Candidatus Yanofskybacteria bacterium RIFCSPHIGHO2_02_FULL_39_10]
MREFVEKNKWITRYDSESDSFSVTKPKLSSDARIKYFDNEIGFYVTKANRVEGIFVEYFGSNFVKHHKDLKEVLKDVKTKDSKDNTLVELSRAKIKKIAPDLEEAIRNTIAEKLELDFKF